jgi:SAM-dependent methyltransferase
VSWQDDGFKNEPPARAAPARAILRLNYGAILDMRAAPGFIDEFSQAAEIYASSRPTYPETLFQTLASLAPATRSAWDCGTGNGQAAAGLAEFFESIEATDASTEQIAHAKLHPRVRYQTVPAEASGLADKSMDLVSVAQALHWFDRDRFFAEVQRICTTPRVARCLWLQLVLFDTHSGCTH